MERINKETLKGWLWDTNVYILDVRSPQAWDASQGKIPQAHHVNPYQPMETWARNLPKDKKLVVY